MRLTLRQLSSRGAYRCQLGDTQGEKRAACRTSAQGGDCAYKSEPGTPGRLPACDVRGRDPQLVQYVDPRPSTTYNECPVWHFYCANLPFRHRPETDKTTAVVAVAIEGTLGVEDLAFRRLNLAES